MLGINGYEFILLGILAVIIVGPERLPDYAAQLGQLVRTLRRMASGARVQLREEMGPEIDDVDWRKLDPRQYDPRRIIKEALADDLEEPIKPPDAGAPWPASGAHTPPPPGPTAGAHAASPASSDSALGQPLGSEISEPPSARGSEEPPSPRVSESPTPRVPAKPGDRATIGSAGQ
ncbi:Sec-independent protein translocase TatB [Arthrobacter sp. Br18]|uniref:Sec-independent protein translocase TatB n=1 Tax=Arthrobacter sp. Br18 TaxID=1312954 RepID=UPI0004AE240C